jgi:predicted HicB family RNase H-like nuclease
MPSFEAVGLMVTVPRELRRKIKIAACERDMTLNSFAAAALEFVASNPDVLSVLELEQDG